MGIKKERLESLLHQEISHIIANEMSDRDLKMVTITDVRLASDLGYAKIYFTTLFGKKRDIVLEDLNKAKGFIKNKLCQRKISIRKIPDLEFVYDISIEEGSKIENLIKEINKPSISE